MNSRGSLLPGIGLFIASANAFGAKSAPPAEPALPQTSIVQLAQTLAVGDIVFIRSTALPFKKVAAATGSWTNHVGIVIEVSGKEVLVAESTFPFSRTTPLSHFVERSERGRVEVMRLNAAMTDAQRQAIPNAARKRTGILYDTGFDLHSPRQFCSRFVREVLEEATGRQVGEVETLATLLERYPGTDQYFWRVWYFGNIPWQRETVTPARMQESPLLRSIFDGFARRHASPTGFPL